MPRWVHDRHPITQGADLMTLVNVFTVEPENQQELVDVLTEATDAVMCQLRGFISANIHRSADGRRVVNYAQWRSRVDFEAIEGDPRAAGHMQQAAALASFDPVVCEVVHTRHV